MTEIFRLVEFPTHQSIPAFKSSSPHAPAALHTFIATILASGATPFKVPLAAAVPATWLPWPWSSIGLSSLLAKS